MLPEVHYGTADSKPLDWRKFKEYGTDDDEVGETPQSVIDLLGFDPAKVTEEGMDSAMPKREAEGTIEEVKTLMEHRSFDLEREREKYSIFSRHDGQISIIVRFRDGKVRDATMTLAAGERGAGKPVSATTKEGFSGLWEFAQAYGD